MDERELKAKQIAHQMNQREKGYLKDIPTREQARHLVEQKKEKEKQQLSSKVVHVPPSKKKTTDTKKPPVTAHNTSTKVTPKKSTDTKKNSTTTKTTQASKPPVTKKKSVANKNQKRSTSSTTKKVRKSHLDAKKVKKGKRSFFTKKHILMLVAIIIFTTVTSIIGISLLKIRQQQVKSPTSQFITLEIEDGMNVAQIAALLEKNTIIDNKNEFINYVNTIGSEKKLLSGFYNFLPHSSYEGVNKILTQKAISPIATITIYRGSVVKEIDDSLSSLQLIQSGQFLEALEVQRVTRNLAFTEGWVFSGEYIIEKGPLLASSLASLVIDRLYDVLKSEIDQAGDLDYSLNDIIIIASMIQRETQDVEQMPLIAGVIYNRLERNEPLGIDATTRYALNAWDRELVRKDFVSSGEYDTRRRVGLPPTGIGSVGIDAIRAALYPDSHNYLYYFHDKEGHLHLSYTYEEHLESFNAL